MKRHLPILLALLFVVNSYVDTKAQIRKKAPVIVCPAGEHHSDYRLGPPAKFRKIFNNNSRLLNAEVTAEIIVNYRGSFTKNTEARDAFQRAVDIWSVLIKSDMPIYLDANFTALDPGVLGSAGTTQLIAAFEGAPNDSTFYNIALAEKLAGKDLNTPGAADVAASFSSEATWYFGLDGETPTGEFDFVTVVLHEIGHGLGFFAVDSFDEDTGEGSHFPGAFDNFIVNSSGTSIYDLENNSVALGNFLTSADLFLNGPQTVAGNGDALAKIYAPSSYSNGSSISHWDEVTFNNTENSLMTPQVAPGESMHDPGPSTMGLFADMGWVNTRIDHAPQMILESYSEDIVVSISVSKDTTMTTEQPMIHYSTDGFATQTDAMMTADGNDQYSITITNPGEQSLLQYYITGFTDVLGRDFSSPSNPVNRHATLILESTALSAPFALTDGGDFESADVFTQIPWQGNNFIWERGAPSNVLNQVSSGTQAWKTDLDADINKPLEGFTTALITPKFDLSDANADYNIKFDLSMDTGSAAGALGLFYSKDGGVTWSSLGEPFDGRGVNWMNRVGVIGNITPGYGWVLDNTANAPETVSYNLSQIIGAGAEEVFFALAFSVSTGFIDSSYPFDGAMVDDFQITKTDPRATFFVSGATVNFPGDEVQFTYISADAETYSWDFGDGNTSDQQNPTHMYSEGGVYDVSLNITYPGGADSNTLESAITIVSTKGSTYSLEDGGDMESNFSDFLAENISGTILERGKSTIEGKDGTASGDNAWVWGINDEQYQDQSRAFLYTPIFDLTPPGEYALSFKANYSFEDGWDGFIVEYTLDFGDTWTQLVPEVLDNWYDRIGIDNPEQGWPDIPLFTGTTNGTFATKTVDISEFSEVGNIGFRFHFLTDFASVEVGSAVDDFRLFTTDGVAIPDFSLTQGDGCSGQRITFTDNSTGNITNYAWDFGANATPATASGPGPHVVEYVSTTASSLSTVKLTITTGTDEEVIEEKVGVISTSPVPDATITQQSTGDNSTVRLVAPASDSYQWYLDGTSIDGATAQEYVATEFGEYSVEVSVAGCSALGSEVRVLTSLDDEVFNKSIVVYPNPSESGQFTIDLPAEMKGNVFINVFDLLGARVSKLNKQIRNGSFELDLRQLKTGSYFLNIENEDRRAIKRIIIN